MTPVARPVAAGTLRLPTRSRAVPTSTRLATRRAPALAVPLLAVLLAGGVVIATQAAGWWATTGRDALSASAGGGTGSQADSGDGGSDVLPAAPADVKGWMTLEHILTAGFPGVTEAGLRAEFAIPADVGLDTPLKELDGVVAGFDVAALREWLAAPG